MFRKFKGCVLSACSCSILCFILIGIPFIVIYEPKHHHKPTNEPGFTLEKVWMAGFNLTSNNHLISLFDISISAHNPHEKSKYKYTNVQVSIYKNKQELAEDSLNGFTQGPRNDTVLTAQTVGLNMTLDEGPANDIRAELQKGYLNFDVSLTATVNADYNLGVYCRNMVVNITVNDYYGMIVDSSGKFRSVNCSVSYAYDNKNDVPSVGTTYFPPSYTPYAGGYSGGGFSP